MPPPGEGFRIAYGRLHSFRSGRHLTSLASTSAQFSVEAWSSTRQLVPRNPEPEPASECQLQKSRPSSPSPWAVRRGEAGDCVLGL